MVTRKSYILTRPPPLSLSCRRFKFTSISFILSLISLLFLSLSSAAFSALAAWIERQWFSATLISQSINNQPIHQSINRQIQGCSARKVNCGRVQCTLCVHIETSSLCAEFVNKNKCISVRLVSEEVKSIKFRKF